MRSKRLLLGSHEYKVISGSLFERRRSLWEDKVWIKSSRMRKGQLSKAREVHMFQATWAFLQAKGLLKWQRDSPGFRLCETLTSMHSTQRSPLPNFPLGMCYASENSKWKFSRSIKSKLSSSPQSCSLKTCRWTWEWIGLVCLWNSIIKCVLRYVKKKQKFIDLCSKSQQRTCVWYG